MRYERPRLIDYGSIAEHTFTRCAGATGGSDAPPKDHIVCGHDKHGECSCNDTGLTP